MIKRVFQFYFKTYKILFVKIEGMKVLMKDYRELHKSPPIPIPLIVLNPDVIEINFIIIFIISPESASMV